MPIAITRKVSPGIGRCELTHLPRAPIDVELADLQHRAYENCLASLGCKLLSLPAEPDLPDSVFVEDVAVVLDEVAIMTRPGAESRRPETASIAEALKPFRPLRFIQPPATLDGGDVLRVGRDVFVGLSARTSRSALQQLTDLLVPFGYRVHGVPIHRCLHLKSAVTQIAGHTLLINSDWVQPSPFPNLRFIEVAPNEPFGANALMVENAVIYPSAFPETRRRLESAGIPVVAVDVSEISKAEGAVTCCSLIFTGQAGNR